MDGLVPGTPASARSNRSVKKETPSMGRVRADIPSSPVTTPAHATPTKDPNTPA
ncbi:hypothetical protein IMZ48_48890 [Candidatus Bathyarchaeota archaeon]|nr:hypothetical protein [Candidatus Bathyarchaeota archaeon]